MLSLFKDAEAPMERSAALEKSRSLLISSLNKGLIPDWDLFFQELPVLNSAEDLDAIKENFLKLTQWPFLENILNQEATEFFFHSADKSQRLLFSGEKIHLPLPLDQADWQLWLEIISIKFKQNWNVQNPFS